MKSVNSDFFQGIDISYADGTIDFSHLQPDIEGAIIRATSNPNRLKKEDAFFRLNSIGIEKAGRKKGFYTYFYPHSKNDDRVTPDTDEAAGQAEFLIETIGIFHREIACVLDLEETNGQTDDVIIADAKAFLETIKRLVPNEPVLVYSNPSFLNEHLKNDAYFSQFLLWIAHWGVAEPADTSIWQSWAGWQYSEKGMVLGISCPTDLDRFTSAVLINLINSTTKTKSDTNILTIQVKLNRLLASDGVDIRIDEDGILGPKTMQSIKSFETFTGLSVDGIWGPQCENAAATILAKPILNIGSRGVAVKYLQSQIGALNDGIFGVETSEKVKTYQRSTGLSPDGIVGSMTWGALIN